MKKYIILAVFILLPSVTFASFDRNLKYGMQGSDVADLQDILNEQGCMNYSSTGYFGYLTLGAVKCFQIKNNISATGYVGILTRGALNLLVINALASSTEAEMAETLSSPTPSPVIVPIQSSFIPSTNNIEVPKLVITGHRTPVGKVCTSGRKEGHVAGVVLGSIEFKRNQTRLNVKEIKGTITEGKENIDNLSNAGLPFEDKVTSLIDWAKTDGEFVIKDIGIPAYSDSYDFNSDIYETATGVVRITIKSITLEDGTVVEGLPIEFNSRIIERCN